MAWRDELRPASFRGVPFFTAGAEKGGGRRAQVHEIPLRDEPFVEEFGRRARRFTLSAYLLGDDVFQQRDRMEEALEKGGAGELVHHFRGTIRVRVLGYQTLESSRAGGFVEISIEFVEAGLEAPDEGVDTAGRVATSAAGASSTLQGVFSNVFTVDDLPDFVADAAQQLVTEASSAIGGAASVAEGERTKISDLNSRLASLTATAPTIIRTPATLAGELAGTLSDLADLAAGPTQIIAAMVELADFGDSFTQISSTLRSRQQQRANQYQTGTLVRRAAILEMAKAASRVEFASYDDAAAERDRVTGLLDAEMLAAGDEGDDEGYEALRQVYADVSADITQRGATLARLITYQPPATVPALALAYSLYGDAAREADLVDRNRLRHPGFVPGGEDLEVLSADV